MEIVDPLTPEAAEKLLRDVGHQTVRFIRVGPRGGAELMGPQRVLGPQGPKVDPTDLIVWPVEVEQQFSASTRFQRDHRNQEGYNNFLLYSPLIPAICLRYAT